MLYTYTYAWFPPNMFDPTVIYELLILVNSWRKKTPYCILQYMHYNTSAKCLHLFIIIIIIIIFHFLPLQKVWIIYFMVF